MPALTEPHTEVAKWLPHYFRLRNLVAIVVLSSSLINSPLSGQPASGEINESFRGGRAPSAAFTVVGAVPGIGIVTGPEEKGYRISVPAQGRQTDRVGLQLETSLKGNFEVTAGYVLQKAGPPIDGNGVGFELLIDLATPAGENLGLLRVSRVNEGEVYLCDHEVVVDGKRQFHIPRPLTPTTARSGRLRISRVGTEAICSAAEGEAGNFEEVQRFDIGTTDVKMIRVAAFLGNRPNAADVFITEVRVRPLTAREATTLAVPPAEAKPGESGGWLTKALLCVAFPLVMLLIVVGVWLSFRSRRHQPVVAAEGHIAEAQVERPVVSFPCTACGKSLKAFATLGGKKVRCSQCGLAVLVPEAV